ncbi:AAA family ATPase [Auraticoccus sp. F435]|uniref:AAA family ATPase n=1 Tax=Auraticoccus cholistanensis TaxID=2656650 RepID=A0A6A9UYU6_9ACTN|nr:AAA family ATPase [Auraticoccus cholistanensis]MVA76827.1 AAA family ATPase [Auraticoccus cholistanensis]
MTGDGGGRVVVITGAMAAGKSTVAELLASRLERSVHIRGDIFRKMVVNGRADMTPEPDEEALAQLRLRYGLATHAADTYAAAGFDAIVQDVVIGAELARFVAQIRCPRRYLVVLSPTVSALAERERQRAKEGYTHYTPVALDATLRQQTARIGYWLDSSAQTPDETVDDILAHLEDARI